MRNDAVERFETTVLLPALDEICTSTAVAKEYAAHVVTTRQHADPSVQELLGSLASALRKSAGPSLVISNRVRPAGISPMGGHYVMSALYEEDEGRVFASPGVIFWMRFNNKLHIFNHRYHEDVLYFPVEEVRRQHVLRHVLASFDFYKLHAFSDDPFPGF